MRGARKGRRPVYFPETVGYTDCPVYDRYKLRAGHRFDGPAVVEERESTVVIVPGSRAGVDRDGNIIVDLAEPRHDRDEPSTNARRRRAPTHSTKPMPAIDPVTFSVIWGGLISTAAEMGVTLTRTAYSVAVREGSDFSTGVFNADGYMVAQGDYSPGHLGSMAYCVRRMLEDYPAETLCAGDAIICNDPGIGAGHLPDLYMMSRCTSTERWSRSPSTSRTRSTSAARARARRRSPASRTTTRRACASCRPARSQGRAGARHLPRDRSQRARAGSARRHPRAVHRQHDRRPAHRGARAHVRRRRAAPGDGPADRRERSADARGDPHAA